MLCTVELRHLKWYIALLKLPSCCMFIYTDVVRKLPHASFKATESLILIHTASSHFTCIHAGTYVLGAKGSALHMCHSGAGGANSLLPSVNKMTVGTCSPALPHRASRTDTALRCETYCACGSAHRPHRSVIPTSFGERKEHKWCRRVHSYSCTFKEKC